uniref:Uncharacterized protein n=1 Tax=Glossina brevipalpis TaxID=37001 RepID=A0A1A9WCC8_9MUSC
MLCIHICYLPPPPHHHPFCNENNNNNDVCKRLFVVGLLLYDAIRRWKGGSIEPHPTDKALIVNYQLEATVFGDPNNPMLGEKKTRNIA